MEMGRGYLCQLVGNPEQYTAPSQQQAHTPAPIAYQTPPAQQSYTPPASGAGTPIPTPLPQSHAQPLSAPLGASGTVPAYGTPVQQPYTPIPPSRQQKLGLSVGSNVLLVVLAIVVVLGAGGGFLIYHFLTVPQLVINVTSKYAFASIPAGSTSTVFHVSGQKFSANSTITFLLDGVPAPGNTSVQSDANGNVTANLTVTDGWTLGNHTLTARDAGNYTTKSGFAVVIVPQGEADTPGPHGAPPDDMGFTINANIQGQSSMGKPLNFMDTLKISGQRDPAGGTVCQSQDNGRPHSASGDLGGGVTYTETVVFKCSGSYKGGKLSYTETTLSDQLALSNGVSCAALMPYVTQRLEGTFNSESTIDGKFSADGTTASCTDGNTVTLDTATGTWTGQIRM